MLNASHKAPLLKRGLSFYLPFIFILFLGLGLRLYQLDLVEVWEDEIATWYFSKNLNKVFLFETHTPLYYGLMRIWSYLFSDSIYSFRLFSVFIPLLCILGVTRYFVMKFNDQIALLFFSLSWLWPTAIVYGRVARQYSLFYSLSFILIICWNERKRIPKIYSWALFSLYSFIHPVGVLLICFLGGVDYLKSRSLKSLFFCLSSIVPILAYYLIRIFIQGGEGVIAPILWINNTYIGFFKLLLLLYAGDIQPARLFYPVGVLGLSFFSLICLIPFILGKISNVRVISKSILLFLTVLLVGWLTEFFNLNFMLNRYYIFIVAFFVYELSAHAEEMMPLKRWGLFVLCLLLYLFCILRPWKLYPWDEYWIKEVKSIVEERPLILCGLSYEKIYYFNQSEENCSKEMIYSQDKGSEVFILNARRNKQSFINDLIKERNVSSQNLGRFILYKVNL